MDPLVAPLQNPSSMRFNFDFWKEEGYTTFQGADILHRGGRIDTVFSHSVPFHTYGCILKHMTGPYYILYHIIDFVLKKTKIPIPHGGGMQM